jgi:predicted ABC-type ATPase
MITISRAVNVVRSAHKKANKPLAIILAGHNGSGKSTLWYGQLADEFQIPLINADRIMMSILPEVIAGQSLPSWASKLRDRDQNWMKVAQKGVEAFVAQAMARKVPFAMETVFSHWKKRDDGTIESKIDLIRQMRVSGYYVLLLFVGLTNYQLSIARVSTRVAAGGHGVDAEKLITRFPRTQEAIRHAVNIADAAILTDNSRETRHAFTVCRIQLGEEEIYDCRSIDNQPPPALLGWLDKVSPKKAQEKQP